MATRLARYPRDSYFFATKYPGHQIADIYDPAAIFEEQLAKCGTEYFDFYLFHNIYEASIEVYLDEQWGIADYFVEQKKNGRIRHLAFRVTVALKRSSVFLTMARASTPSLSSAILKLQPCSRATTSWNSARSS